MCKEKFNKVVLYASCIQDNMYSYVTAIVVTVVMGCYESCVNGFLSIF